MGNGTRILRIERIRINKNQLNPFDPRPIAIFYLTKTLFGNKSIKFEGAMRAIKRMKIRKIFLRRLKTYIVGNKAGTILLVAGLLILVGGFASLHQNEWTFVNIVDDLYANFGSELISIAITVLIIDFLYRRGEEIQLKAQLIREISSANNGFARRAVSQLDAHGWLTDGSLRNANLEKADLREANLEKADLAGVNLEEAHLETANLREANLQDTNLSRANLSEANLFKACLIGAKLHRSKFEDAGLFGANLKDANLSEANLERTYLEEADLTNANLIKTNLTDTRLAKTNLTRADLSKANLTRARLWRANLERAILWAANLEEANLEEANLKQVDLAGANLRKANLVGTNLEGADLENAVLEGVVYDSTTIWPEGFIPISDCSIRNC